MIVGQPKLFAIEHSITHACRGPGLRALGYFSLHIDGFQYGVVSPDATMLACSFYEVGDRIARRGTHFPSVNIDDIAAAEIADSVIRAIYDPGHEDSGALGLARDAFIENFYGRHLEWAPDGDEAFDDGSHVFQFDRGNQVRLIAFRTIEYQHDPSTLREIWMNADEFYKILSDWHTAFEMEWNQCDKEPDYAELTAHPEN